MTERDAPPRLSREQARAETRARLMAAARREVARKGAGASVRDIAAAAGYTQGALYAHFENKELLLLALLAEQKDNEISALNQMITHAEQAPEAARSALDAWLDALHDDADWALLAVELELHARRDPAFAERYDALAAEQIAMLGAFIERFFASQRSTPPAPPERIAAALVGLTHGLALQRDPATAAPIRLGPPIKLMLDALLRLGADGDV